MPRLRGLVAVRAWEAAERVQGLRGVVNLHAPTTEEPVPGMRGVFFLPTRPEAQHVPGMPGGRPDELRRGCEGEDGKFCYECSR